MHIEFLNTPLSLIYSYTPPIPRLLSKSDLRWLGNVMYRLLIDSKVKLRASEPPSYSFLEHIAKTTYCMNGRTSGWIGIDTNLSRLSATS
jgi:hypothetical protein